MSTIEPIRSARNGAMLRFIAAHFILVTVVNLVLFAGGAFRLLASATGGLFTGSLVVNVIFLVALVGGLMIQRGGLRPYDVGLIPRHIPVGILYTIGFWGAAQAIHALAGLLAHGRVELAPEWSNAGFMIGLLLAQLVGNALFEEIAYRGFLFPQLYLSLGGRPWARFGLALLISQAIFAIAHIPNRIYLGFPAHTIAADLLLLVCWGIFYTLIYLRTDNLFIVVGAHSLGNAPTTLFATAPFLRGNGESLLIYLLIALVLFGLPLLRAARAPAVES